MSARDVVITGIGLVSSLGEGTDAHWRKLSTPGIEPVIDETRYAPYVVHPLPEIDWSLQIAKRGDQRQMENWQRLGTYAAGLALDDAGMKGDEALCATMDMIVAAGGGERDEAVDQAILEASATRNDRDVLLNEKLTTELRPTLFLAQLSNLLAGNISIVHKVTGSSRTFMGEEGAGISAVETAAARIRSGQSTHALVGGAFQTEHSDMLLAYELGRYLHRGPWKTVWDRSGAKGGGVVTGSGAAFLVLELRQHAEAARMPYLRRDGGSGVSTEQPHRWRDGGRHRRTCPRGRRFVGQALGIVGRFRRACRDSRRKCCTGTGRRFRRARHFHCDGPSERGPISLRHRARGARHQERRRLSALRSRPRARVRRRARGCARHRDRLSSFRGAALVRAA